MAVTTVHFPTPLKVSTTTMVGLVSLCSLRLLYSIVGEGTSTCNSIFSQFCSSNPPIPKVTLLQDVLQWEMLKL